MVTRAGGFCGWCAAPERGGTAISVRITPEVTQQVAATCREGGFADETAAHGAYRQRQQVIAKINAGVAQLDRGEGSPADVVLDRLQRKSEQEASRADASESSP